MEQHFIHHASPKGLYEKQVLTHNLVATLIYSLVAQPGKLSWALVGTAYGTWTAHLGLSIRQVIIFPILQNGLVCYDFKVSGLRISVYKSGSE